MAALKLRKRPTKPQRGMVTERVDVDDGDNIQELLEQLRQKVGSVLPLTEIRIDINYCYDNAEVELVWHGEEPEGVFKARSEQYKKNLASYNKWRRENKDPIAAEKARQAEIFELEKKLRKLKQ